MGVFGDVDGWLGGFWTSGIVSVLNSIWPKSGLNEFQKNTLI